MSYRTITINCIEVLGYIWMPGDVLCGQRYDLSPYDLENIGELTRANAERWLMCHSGDFSRIVDFRADIGDFESPWGYDTSEALYSDCMYHDCE